MFVESDYLRCRLTLTHEEAEAMARFLNARKFGGEMKSGDFVVVDTVLANLQEHNRQIAERLSRIGEVESTTFEHRIRAGIQKMDISEFEQFKRPTETAADYVDEASLVNVNEVAARLKAVGHNTTGDLADKLIASGILGNN